MNKTAHIAGIFVCVAVLAVPLQAQSSESEVENLKKRVRQLEEQNQDILKTIEELKARIAGKPQAPPPATALPALAPQATSQKPNDQPVQWPELATQGNRLKFYGFLRLDMVTDSTRPDSSQSAFYILSEDSRAGGTHAQNFTLYPRLTRFGINFAGPAVPILGNSKLSGQLEVDFNNGGRESRPIPRFRHAYFKLTHGAFFMLAGQTYDLMSPLMPTPNTDTLMWNAGNLGDRRPQLQAVYEPKAGSGQFYFGASAALTGAIDGQDLDNNGFRDGEESGRPSLQGRVAYTQPFGSKGLKAGIGISGHRGWEYTTKAVAGIHDFYSQSIGVDYTLALAEPLTLRGETWLGRNLSDVRGGIGQGINLATGAAIRSRGGWSELMLRIHPRWTIAPGFTIDDPRDQDVPVNGRTRNRAWYFANRFSLGGGFLVGADYLRWITDYRGLLRGADNRVNIFFQYGY